MRFKVLFSRFSIIFSLLFVFSCVQNSNQEVLTSDTSNPPNEKYEILGDEIFLKNGPGDNYDKIVNEKATAYLEETQYLTVDYSTSIIILEEKDNWSKVQVVDPPHLSASHIGWIPTKYINRNQNETPTAKLDSAIFEILKTDVQPKVTNYHVLIKLSKFNEEEIRLFIQQFRDEFCKGSSNVYVYDSKSVVPLMDKYPLEDKKEYIKLADHFVASSSFDSPKVMFWYPYQDIQYKEYGGNNWKKKPII